MTDATEPDILERLENSVLWLTLNRPDAHNAVTPDQRNRLIARFNAASADLNVRAIVLTAVGKGFCTGADLRGDRDPAAARPEGAPERSFGDVARAQKQEFMRALALGTVDTRIWADDGKDHVGSARAAYGDEGIYRWLLQCVR